MLSDQGRRDAINEAAWLLSRELPERVVPTRDEKRLHYALDRAIRAILPEVTVQPEHALSAGDRIDYFLPQYGIGIEVKVKGSPLQVGRQLERYASHPQIKHLVLITTRYTHGGLAGALDGLVSTPVTVIRLQGAL